MRFAPLASGSRGNATLLEFSSTRILGDAGLPAREVAHEAIRIASEICLYTNDHITVEVLGP